MGLPIRSCIACRKRENQSDLLRVVKSGKQVSPDPAKRMNGRVATAVARPQAIARAITKRTLGPGAKIMTMAAITYSQMREGITRVMAGAYSAPT